MMGMEAEHNLLHQCSASTLTPNELRNIIRPCSCTKERSRALECASGTVRYGAEHTQRRLPLKRDLFMTDNFNSNDLAFSVEM
eukprot:scaffold1505_cov146-Skeletonema_marinoi.AAC.26